jgi:hypothetical protein
MEIFKKIQKLVQKDLKKYTDQQLLSRWPEKLNELNDIIQEERNFTKSSDKEVDTLIAAFALCFAKGKSVKSLISAINKKLEAWEAGALYDKLSEIEWVDKIAPELGCDKKDVEVLLADGSRCDILLPSCKNYPQGLAIEVDWCKNKWKEAPGQALLYSALTNSPPGVLLLLKGLSNEELHLSRCLVTCRQINAILWAYDTINKKWLNLHPLPLVE